MILGYPAAVIPAGEHPVNAKCRRRIYPPFSACKTTPAVRKILPIFPTAFTGCNTLHFALQSRVPDVPSGLPYGRSYALLILRSTLRIKEWQHDGDGSCEGVFQNTVIIDMTVMQGIRVTVEAVGRGYPKTAVTAVTAVTQRAVYPPKKGR